MLPAIATYFVEFALPGRFLKYAPDGRNNDTSLADGAIMPFAQRDMVDTFMGGIDPDFYSLIQVCLTELVDAYPALLDQAFPGLPAAQRDAGKTVLETAGADELDKIKNRIEECRRQDYAGPIIDVVGMLPIDELAGMAEALVSLTSLKRRMSLDEETVGGPIDVAVISKGDGLIWIKRKHYFEPALNQHFFENKRTQG